MRHKYHVCHTGRMKISRLAAAGAATTLLALGTIAAGCGGGDTAMPTDLPKDAAYSDVLSTNGSGESAMGGMVDGTFVVRLDCSPGTGYQWKLKTTGDTVLKLDKTTGCVTGEGTTSAVGASGYETRTYDIMKAGTEVLTFTWVPPGNTTPEATQVITFNAS